MSNQHEKYYINVHQELITRCYQKDEDAQKQIYRLYYKAMYNTAYRILQDEHLAEDVMQEAFLKAFTKINTYNNQSSFGAWLKRIVINHSLNMIRKKSAVFYPEFNYAAIHSDEAKETEEINWDETDFNLVMACMSELKLRYTTILNLILIEGYDLQEVAEIMEISNGNARVLYMRAKNKLKEIVKRRLCGKKIN